MPRKFSFHHPITSSMHYNRAIICFQNAFGLNDGSFLFYAALELRISIERFLFEYLVIMNVDEYKIETYMKEYRIKNLSNAIYDAEPEFDKKLEYTNFYLNTIGADFEIKIPDTNILNSYNGKRSNYLHNLKRPADTVQRQEWWDNFIDLLEKTRAYLFEFIGTPRAFFQMNEYGLKLYQEFKKETLTRDEIAQKILESFI
jgi:hypothetical protein